MPLPSSLSLQQEIYSALTGSTSLVALLGGTRVYDDTPEDTPFPYITLGQSIMRDWSTASDQGREHLLRLHVWSRETGGREAQLISEEIINVLHDAVLNLQDNALINLRFLGADHITDADRKTHHSILRFRAVTEPTI